MEEEKLGKGKVLVTGITGFIGSYVAKLLLEKGYKVRGTVRDKKNAKKMKALDVLPRLENLEIVEADLLDSDCWDGVVKGCDYVMHVASPFILQVPRDENVLIRPAVQGTLNVLKMCHKHKVKSVVLTSSIASIMSAGASYKPVYTEEDWADLRTIPAYNKSKTMAEQAAWDYWRELDPKDRFKFSAINPGIVFGPSLVDTDFSSGDTIRQFLTGALPAIPSMHFAIVDVRDVAAAHIAAMESPVSNGQRYICAAEEHLWAREIAQVLRERFGKYGYKVPRCNLCYCCMKFASLWDRQARFILPFWGRASIFKNDKIKKDLGITFISPKEAICEMAFSLIKYGLVPNKIKGKDQEKLI